ncbi:MAG: Lon protease [Candidatus Woesebacteria bacterium GW2011_GWA1_37_8]|uniref:Lon protease n=1 Tax=Candidatus Woesebacteria bacterium GW2011_GWA1_37_8 TaxID=1618546 RepID=A0A0G0I375_9BACT|nr:MAG: Lon protease [Microgenomates group bacterium GW2011_GWC1_37_12b]KKQ45395.1 MAG: Lon protease [Candidatus Woesebacteria bacterium GW2011_GWA1_37_8]
MSIVSDEIKKQLEVIAKADVPNELRAKLSERFEQLKLLEGSPSFMSEYDRWIRYLDWIVSLPWNKTTEDKLDLDNAKSILEETHYGLQEIKDKVLEYLSVMKLKIDRHEEGDVMRAPILCFVGLVGTGKTTISSTIARAMGRNFARIPFGGMGDPLDLRGQSKMHPEAEPGKVIKALRQTQSKNCVILLDEIDRVTDEGRASIMGVLVELLDPKQNFQYTDYYIDYPFDLSSVLFIATSNNTHNIATAVLDRMEPIQMPSYVDEEKITIGKRYMLPRILKESGVPDGAITIDDAVWAQIVRPLGFDAGMRTLERTVSSIVKKIARLIVEGKAKTFQITPENVKQYLS